MEAISTDRFIYKKIKVPQKNVEKIKQQQWELINDIDAGYDYPPISFCFGGEFE